MSTAKKQSSWTAFLEETENELVRFQRWVLPGSTARHQFVRARQEQLTMKHKIIPYQPHLKEIAKKLRQNINWF